MEGNGLGHKLFDLLGTVGGRHTSGKVGHEGRIGIPRSFDDYQIITHRLRTLLFESGLPENAGQLSLEIVANLTCHRDRARLDGMSELSVAAGLTIKPPAVGFHPPWMLQRKPTELVTLFTRDR